MSSTSFSFENTEFVLLSFFFLLSLFSYLILSSATATATAPPTTTNHSMKKKKASTTVKAIKTLGSLEQEEALSLSQNNFNVVPQTSREEEVKDLLVKALDTEEDMIELELNHLQSGEKNSPAIEKEHLIMLSKLILAKKESLLLPTASSFPTLAMADAAESSSNSFEEIENTTTISLQAELTNSVSATASILSLSIPLVGTTDAEENSSSSEGTLSDNTLLPDCGTAQEMAEKESIGSVDIIETTTVSILLSSSSSSPQTSTTAVIKEKPIKAVIRPDNVLSHLPLAIAFPLCLCEYAFDSSTTFAAESLKFFAVRPVQFATRPITSRLQSFFH